MHRFRRIPYSALRDNYETSFQDLLLRMYAVSLFEYDGVIQVWREKVRHNLVRPTTVIKHWDDDMIYTYGGNISLDEPVAIPARDFESLLSPHEPSPEFPSVNSCFCEALREFFDLYTVEMYGEKIENYFFIDTSHGTIYFLEDMTKFRDDCAAAQVFAGVHFTASVTGGIELCSGLGTLAFEYINDVKNGSDFNGGWYVGDDLPECPTPPAEP